MLWTDTDVDVPFTRPTIASPTCSDDSSDIWLAWIEPKSSNYDSTVFKISIDNDDGKIKVTGHSGK